MTQGSGDQPPVDQGAGRARTRMAVMATTFPTHLVSDVVLRDGSTVRVRPTRPSDVTRVEDYLIGLSPETRRLRFWSQAIDVGGSPGRSSRSTMPTISRCWFSRAGTRGG